MDHDVKRNPGFSSRTTHRWRWSVLWVTLSGCLLWLAPAAAAERPAATMWGLEIPVSDVERAVSFYEAGFRFVLRAHDARHEQATWAVLQLQAMRLVLRQAASLPAPADATRAYLNLHVRTIEPIAAHLVGLGATRLDPKPRRVAIGDALTIRDPFGNQLNLMDIEGRRLPEGVQLAPFNVGIKVPTIAHIEPTFAALGFEVWSRDYLPATLVLAPNGVIPLVLHRGAAQASGTAHSQSALLLAVDDLDRLLPALRRLERAPTSHGGHPAFEPYLGSEQAITIEAASGLRIRLLHAPQQAQSSSSQEPYIGLGSTK